VGLRDNKLLRSKLQVQAKNKFANGENQPTADEQLTRLEDDIRRLRIEFDIFFNGAAKRPPYDTKGRVETLLKRLGDDRTLTYAQRYRYTSLGARYNAFRELWRRTMQGREEGRDPASNARAHVKKGAVETEPVSGRCEKLVRFVDWGKAKVWRGDRGIFVSEVSPVGRPESGRVEGEDRLRAREVFGERRRRPCELQGEGRSNRRQIDKTNRKAITKTSKAKEKATAGGRLSFSELTGPVTGSSQWLC
jgi:hypothetical protein